MAISLKNYTISYLSLALFLLITLWAGLFYAFILDEVYDNVDDGLKNQKIEIIREAYINDKVLHTTEFGVNQFRIVPINQHEFFQKDILHNEMVYMPYDNEMEPYRVLKSSFLDKDGQTYLLEIRTSTVEEDDLIIDLLIALAVLYGILIVSIFIINHLVLNKAFKPFKNILEQLNNYRFGEQQFIQPKSKVSEFNTLSNGIIKMIDRNQETFLQQKVFIENASHELQTPLAIVQNKLDWMIENEDLAENQLEQLVDIKRNIRRMSGLNQSLLMLSKIENQQFSDEQLVDANALIKDILSEMEEWFSYKMIQVNLIEKSDFSIKMNPQLLEILISNLLRNALKYTNKNGNVLIEINQNKIIIGNTSNGVFLNKNLIFERFYKNSSDQQSVGLGLSIVQSIVKQTENLKIDYQYFDPMHQFILEKIEN